MKGLVYILSFFLIAIGVRTMFNTSIYVAHYRLTIDIGEHGPLIGMIFILVGVVIFIEQYRQ